MEVCPDGRVGYALSPEGSADYERGYQAKLIANRRVDLEPPLDRIAPVSASHPFNCDMAACTWPSPHVISAAPPAATLQGPVPDPAQAPPLAGFRALHTCRLDPELEFVVPLAGSGGTSRERVCVDLTMECSPVIHMGATGGNFDANVRLRRETKLTMWAHEDGLCHGVLGKLGEGPEFCYGPESTLDTLIEFVQGLNSGRPREVHLDTVFMDTEMHMRLFGQDRRTYGRLEDPGAYENMVQMRGMAFIRPKGLHATGAFVTSSAQGPVFVNGPHTARRDRDGLHVTHHCALVRPPRQVDSEIPWGTGITPRFG